MTIEELLLLVFLVAILIFTVGVKLYQAKKNDGVITKDEVEDIVRFLGDGTVNILQQLINVKPLDKDQKTITLQKEILKIVKESSATEVQKKFVIDNIDIITQKLISSTDKVLDDLLKKHKQEILTSIYTKVEESKAIKEETDNFNLKENTEKDEQKNLEEHPKETDNT